MADHDKTRKRFFGHRRSMADLLRGFVSESWVGELDLTTLERLSGSFVSGGLTERHGDMVWRVRSAAAGSAWLYVHLLLEFQSRPDRFMAVRLLTYSGLLLEELVRRRMLTPDRRLPPLLPIVLYSGERPWRAPLDLRQLFAPVPEALAGHLPDLRYLLLDEGRLAAESLAQPDNRAAAFFRLQGSPTPEEIFRLGVDLDAQLSRTEEGELRDEFATLLREGLRRALPGATIPQASSLEEISMLERNMDRWRESLTREAKAKGLEEGQVVGMRNLLVRLLTNRFGPLPLRVRRRLQTITSAEELGQLAERVLAVGSLGELGLG